MENINNEILSSNYNIKYKEIFDFNDKTNNKNINLFIDIIKNNDQDIKTDLRKILRKYENIGMINMYDSEYSEYKTSYINFQDFSRTLSNGIIENNFISKEIYNTLTKFAKKDEKCCKLKLIKKQKKSFMFLTFKINIEEDFRISRRSIISKTQDKIYISSFITYFDIIEE